VAQSLQAIHRVLVIDDTKGIHEDFRKILAPSTGQDEQLAAVEAALFGEPAPQRPRARFSLDSAYQGAEGLSLARRALQEGRRYEVAFVDVRMPPGLDGVETTAKLWEIDPDIQVVICTAYSDYSWDDMIEQVGHSDRLVILKKPFDMVEVLQLANALTEKWRLLQANRSRLDALETEVAERTTHLEEANRRLQAEISLSRQREDALRLQYDVTRILADAGSSHEEVTTRILERICQGMLWDVGEVWGLEGQGLKLRRTAVWHRPGERFQEFEGGGRNLSLPSGKGLPGMVWETGESVWVADLSRNPRSVRKEGAARAGLKSALAFPIRPNGQFLGVIVFLGRETREPEQTTLQMCEAIGSLIGQSIERRKLEDQLRQSQKMDAIGHLAGGVAHDFNNILTVIMGFAQILKMSPQLDPESSDCLNQVFFASERAANLVRQLLMFSRKQVIQPKALDLNPVTNNLAKMLRRVIGEDVSLTIKPAPAPASVYADEGMMEQVMMNLAVNARDAMPKGGRLTIQVETATFDQASLPTHIDARPGNFVCLSVADNGCGIRPEDLPRIFEPFFTTKEVGRGTGLGLSTVYGIVKQHKGWIDVTSQAGVGTTLRIYLPRLQEQAAIAKKADPSVQPRGGTETILVVEDETPVRSLAKRLLERRGYRVLEAGSGVQALEVWAAHRQEIDLVLTDVVMPEGMSGRDLVERLLEEKPGLKFIYSTGYNPEQSRLYTGPVEPINLLPKPYDPRQLLETVRACLDHIDQGVVK